MQRQRRVDESRICGKGWVVLARKYIFGCCIVATLTFSLAARDELSFEKRWTWKGTRWADSSPALADNGILYFGSFDQKFWAVDTNGQQQWSFKTGSEIRSSPAIANDGTIYFGCRDRKFYALTPEGKEKWEYNVGAWVDSSPAIGDNGTIYFGAWDHDFYALNSDASLKWKFHTGGIVSSSPAIGSDQSIYFGSHDGKFYALDPNGIKRWEFKAGGAILSSPAINSEGIIYFTSLDGFFYALDKDGHLFWKLHTRGVTDSSPVIGTDGILFVGVNNAVWAVSPEGQKKWDFVMPHPLRTPLIAMESGVLISSFQGYLMSLDESKSELARFPLWGETAASPILTKDGMLYIFGTYGYLFAFNSGAVLAKSSWPRFGVNVRNTANLNDPKR